MDIIEETTGEIPETTTLDRITGMDAAKRALEVSLAGAHPMIFLYNGNSQAVELVKAGKRIAEKHGLAFHGLAYPACKCGNFGSRTGHCTCKRSSVRHHLAKLGRREHQVDIWLDACRAKLPEIGAEPDEPETVTAERILTAGKLPKEKTEPEKEAMELLNAWQKHVGRTVNTGRILKVAGTIARIEGNSGEIRAYHMAEAIQYQVQSVSWLWDCLAPQLVELKNKTGKR